ncbi:Cytochrome P450(BM-3) [Dermatophilus congolensis]|uniref:Bifunctional cytochrome P450/NADPH--P450 reductase n=2 Tax=Dermatophilus congolensis TaxID=1863 RepID=A0AA46GZH0_9MICO|nr:cytochrome P450 [Dermatophilus congolensis]STD03863.1 Cytochrome P450(BM-3) [Dermatophilus congolensis]
MTITSVPGPEVRPVTGTLHALDPERPIQASMELAKKYGEIFRHQFPGKPAVYFVSSFKLTDELCDESRFDKRVHGSLENIRSFAGDGLFTAYTGEENWGRAHRILMPAFSPLALRGMFDGMSDIAEQLMLKWERLGPDADIDVVNDFIRLTLDTIALCSFSYRFNSFYSDSLHPFVNAMVEALNESGQQNRRIPLQNRLMVVHQRRYAENIRVMKEIAGKLITQRQATPLPNGNSDILDTMLKARDPQTGEGLSDENVRYQMVTFLIAGHETTSGLLSFTVYELLRNPQVMATARELVDTVLQGRFPTYEDLSQLGYLDQILRETLRLWPTAPAFALHPYETTLLADQFEIHPDETAMVLTPSLHRDPTVWEDPERFDPDRFSYERAKDIPANAWKPFGNGQRSCLGRAFALQEAQLVLALLLQRFDIDWSDPTYTLKIKETLTLKPDGLFVRLRRREGVGSARVTSAVENVTETAPETIAEAHGTPVQILFGSNAGTCEAFANQIAGKAKTLGYSPTVHPLDEGIDNLCRDGATLIVTASYEGQPPDNARRFVRWLGEQAPNSLRGVRFAVFGCGNTDWARTYQRIPTIIDEGLQTAGAQRLLERGEANVKGDFFGDFETWQESMWPAVAHALGVATPTPDTVNAGLHVEVLGEGRSPIFASSELGFGTVVANRELVDTSQPGGRSKRHLEIALPPGATYHTGDYLVVLPLNPASVVDRVLNRFDLAYDTRLLIESSEEISTKLPLDEPISAGELFAEYVELSRPASRRHISQLADVCSCPPEKKKLLFLAEEENYEPEILEKRRSVLDLLEEFRSVSLSLSSFLSMLTPLSTRQYSISSSPLWSSDHVTLTVAHLSEPARSGRGQHHGVASSYLAGTRPGARIPVSVRSSSMANNLPQDVTTPVIMACAGTGIAPFRGFVQQRALQAQEKGVTPAPTLLFFGCHSPNTDLLYAEEFAAWEQEGIVDIRPAFSRAPEEGPEGPMRYVQDRMWADRADIIDLVNDGASLFVCGDGERMAPAVRDVCTRICAEAKNISIDEAQEWLTSMEQEHERYVSDVFA